jgi:hypothetical protein
MYINAVSNAGCIGTHSTEVFIDANASKANAGPDRIQCNITNSILAAISRNWFRKMGTINRFNFC